MIMPHEKDRYLASKTHTSPPATEQKKEEVKPLKVPDGYQKVFPPFINLLPGELRNKIYELIGFRRSKRVDLAKIEEHYFAQVFNVLPKLRAEINSFFFADCMFEIDVYSRFSVYPGTASRQCKETSTEGWDVGKLAIPDDHWAREENIGVHFSKVTLVAKETRGSVIARVYFVARPSHVVKSGVPRASMIVRDIESVNIKKSLAIMTKKARRLVSTYSHEADFAGFTMPQLDRIAACFTWTEVDIAAENKRLHKYTQELEDTLRGRATKSGHEYMLGERIPGS